MRVAIVGSGPAGFFAAEALLKSDIETYVDMFERLPTPYGLVRSGVAPDHQSVKQITRIYEKAVEVDRFRFFGNVEVGKDISVAELRARYDQIVFAVGNEGDRRLGIPNEGAVRCAPSRVFVGWYNGHPDYRHFKFDLNEVETVVVVGNGNVSGDVTRMLAHKFEDLLGTDIAEHALDILELSTIKRVIVLGRQGPAQVAYTPRELGEMGKLGDVAIQIDPADLVLDEVTEAFMARTHNPATKKNLQLFEGWAARQDGDTARVVEFRFFRDAREVLIDEENCIKGLRVEKTRNVDKGERLDVELTGETEIIDAQMMITAIGFQGQPIEGVPFDLQRRTIANQEGRVVEGAQFVGDMYVVGWAKTGPQGQIGLHRKASAEVVELMKADLQGLPHRALPPLDEIKGLLERRNSGQITFSDWKALDELETRRGRRRGTPRMKFTGVDDVLEVLGKA
ncbi:FAD-dependent oxidoreductase [Myxococcota bacterium]|nr:FAD-dependent oxidoreductase [Myxococcota bacterium]MBU1429011.1 FAD-dependent oxidoreductase [Myxococcota bacterium]MBU1898433.1 FAD-dependent oxidoreductase [Myxococcota bacterium]